MICIVFTCIFLSFQRPPCIKYQNNPKHALFNVGNQGSSVCFTSLRCTP